MNMTPKRPALAAILCAWLVFTSAPAFADILSGGLIGSLLRGDQFTGPRVIDFLALGLIVYFLFSKLFQNRRNDEDDDGYPERPDESNRRGGLGRPPSQGNPRPPQQTFQNDARPDGKTPPVPPAAPGPQGGPDAGSQDPRQTQADAYRAAEAAWDWLRSDPSARKGPAAPGPAPGAPQAGSYGPPAGEDEFLAGAKAAYARIRQSLDAGDLEGVRSLIDPAYFETLSRQEKSRTPLKDLTILLVEAQKTGQSETGGQTRAQVTYHVLAKRTSSGDQDLRFTEIWTFARPSADPSSMWRLSDMRQE